MDDLTNDIVMEYMDDVYFDLSVFLYLISLASGMKPTAYFVVNAA